MPTQMLQGGTLRAKSGHSGQTRMMNSSRGSFSEQAMLLAAILQY